MMMNHLKRIFSCFSLLGIVSLCGVSWASASGVELSVVSQGEPKGQRVVSYDLSEGARQRVEVKTEVVVSTPLVQTPQTQTQTVYLDVTIGKKQKAGGWLVTTLTDADVFKQLPGLDQLTTQTLFKPDGESKVVNLEEQLRSLRKVLGEQGAVAEKMLDSLTSATSNTGMRFPKAPVGQGAVWTVKSTEMLGQLGGTELLSRYTLKKLTKTSAELHFEADIDMSGILGDAADQAGLKMKMTNMKMSGTYLIRFDRTLATGKVSSEMRLETTLPSGDVSTMNMVTHVTMSERAR